MEKFKDILVQLENYEQRLFKNYIDKKANEEEYRFKIQYYDCAKYIVENEYYFYKYIKYIKSQIEVDKENFKFFLEEMNDNIQFDNETKNHFSNFIEQNKKDDVLYKIKVPEFVDKVFPFTRYDFELIAFRNKKSVWKFLLDDVNYKDEKITSHYNQNNVKSYLEGFMWVVDWYFNRMRDPNSLKNMSTWFYHNQSSNPFYITNLLDYINKNKDNELKLPIQFVSLNNYLTDEEHKIYTVPTEEEEKKFNQYSEDITKFLHKTKLNYVTDSKRYVYDKLLNKCWNKNIVINCKHARYLEKCRIGYDIDTFENFIKKYRQRGGKKINYKYKYCKYYYKKY